MYRCKKGLKKQLVAALDSIYLNQFRDEATNSICTSIPDILSHLFHSYGNVPSDKLAEEGSRMTHQMFYLISSLISLMHPLPQDYQKLTTKSSIMALISSRKLVNMRGLFWNGMKNLLQHKHGSTSKFTFARVRHYSAMLEAVQ